MMWAVLGFPVRPLTHAEEFGLYQWRHRIRKERTNDMATAIRIAFVGTSGEQA